MGNADVNVVELIKQVRSRATWFRLTRGSTACPARPARLACLDEKSHSTHHDDPAPQPTQPTPHPNSTQAVLIGAVLYFVWVNVIKFFLDVLKLSSIPGPTPIPVLGNLYDKTALTSVRCVVVIRGGGKDWTNASA